MFIPLHCCRLLLVGFCDVVCCSWFGMLSFPSIVGSSRPSMRLNAPLIGDQAQMKLPAITLCSASLGLLGFQAKLCVEQHVTRSRTQLIFMPTHQARNTSSYHALKGFEDVENSKERLSPCAAEGQHFIIKGSASAALYYQNASKNTINSSHARRCSHRATHPLQHKQKRASQALKPACQL